MVARWSGSKIGLVGAPSGAFWSLAFGLMRGAVFSLEGPGVRKRKPKICKVLEKASRPLRVPGPPARLPRARKGIGAERVLGGEKIGQYKLSLLR